MITSLSVVTIVVDDVDEALAFYTNLLGFEVRADEEFGPGVRWVTVAPPMQDEVEIHLQELHPEMHGEEGAERLRELVGHNPAWSFQTDDCEGTSTELQSAGVTIVREPTERPYGVEAVFEDLYGNRFSLLEPATA